MRDLRSAVDLIRADRSRRAHSRHPQDAPRLGRRLAQRARAWPPRRIGRRRHADGPWPHALPVLRRAGGLGRDPRRQGRGLDPGRRQRRLRQPRRRRFDAGGVRRRRRDDRQGGDRAALDRRRRRALSGDGFDPRRARAGRRAETRRSSITRASSSSSARSRGCVTRESILRPMRNGRARATPKRLRRRLVTAEDSKTVRSLLRETFAACDDRCEALRSPSQGGGGMMATLSARAGTKPRSMRRESTPAGFSTPCRTRFSPCGSTAPSLTPMSPRRRFSP